MRFVLSGVPMVSECLSQFVDRVSTDVSRNSLRARAFVNKIEEFLEIAFTFGLVSCTSLCDLPGFPVHSNVEFIGIPIKSSFVDAVFAETCNNRGYKIS